MDKKEPSVEIPKSWRDFAVLPGEILRDEALTIYAKMLVAVVNYHAWDGGFGWPGQDRISKLGSFSIRQVNIVTNELEKSGYLQVIRRKGKTSLYKFISKATPAQGADLPLHGVQGLKATPAQGADLPLHGVQTNETNITRKNKTLDSASPEPGKEELLKPFTAWWSTEFPREFGKPYDHRGAVDAKLGKALIAYFRKALGPDRQAEVLPMLQKAILETWRNPKIKADEKFLGPAVKSIAGFKSVINRLNFNLGVVKETGSKQETYFEKVERWKKEKEASEMLGNG